ncbi:MAG: hypothetical protein WC421_10730 [Elusimicrobiales bacterium]
MRRRAIIVALAFAMGAVFGFSVNGIQRAAKGRLEASAKKTADSSASVRKLGKKLNLSPKQRVEIAKIVDNRQRDIQELKSEFRPKYATLRETMKQEIGAVLDEQQKTRFKSMTEQAENSYPWLREVPARPTPLEDGYSRPDGEGGDEDAPQSSGSECDKT